MHHLPLSFLDPPQLGVFIPILAIVTGIVAILTKHQQRMAEIIHGTAQVQAGDEVAQLRREVLELKQLVHQQMIALDSFSNPPRRSEDAPLQQRLEQV